MPDQRREEQEARMATLIALQQEERHQTPQPAQTGPTTPTGTWATYASSAWSSSEPSFSVNQYCSSCGDNCYPENAHNFRWDEDRLWCNSCHENNHFSCESCGSLEMIGNSCRWGCEGELRYCHDCEQDSEHMSCGSCGFFFDLDEGDWEAGDGRYCRRCVDNGAGSGSLSYRNYTEKAELVAQVAGKTMTSLRTVGIELEVEYGSKKNAIQAVKKMPKCIGIGSDASISGAGLELRFPPAVGKQLEEIVVQTCTALKDNEIKVNPSCGYHVHIDMTDFGELEAEKQLKAIKSLWILYLAFEDVLVSFLPPSRHGNKYCKTIRAEYSIGEVLNCRNRDDLERMWYRVRTAAQLHEMKTDSRHSYSDDQTRYRGINFHPFWREGHMEVRYHTGTINPVKILEWANLHAKMVDAATIIRLDKAMIDHLKTACNSFDMEQKTNLFFDIIKVSKESEGYYQARQEKFKRAERKIKETPSFKSGMKLLEEEKEV